MHRYRNLVLRVGAILAVVVSLVAVTSAASAQSARNSGSSGHFKHVIVIMMENTGFGSLIGNPSAPWINSAVKKYLVAADYYGVTHPSQPNYIASTSGSLNGVTADSPTTLNVSNIVDQLEAKHVAWKAYMQSLNDCVSGVSTPSGIVGETNYKFDAACGVAPYGAQLYERKHDAFVTYDDVANSAARMANVVDLSQFTTDLAANKLPDYSWISPDQCHDMHGTSTAGNPCDFSQEQSIISMGDTFLKQTVHQIMSSRVWKENTAIFITWDEADYTGAGFQGFGDDSGCCDSPSGQGGGHVLTLVITKHNQAKNGQRVSFVPYNHFSMLSTIEKNFGLPCLANTCDIANVKPMTGLK